MINLQLYILNENGESYDEVELYDNESVSYTQSLQDIRDISKIFSDYSRTFSVPASKTNNIIFKHFYNYFIDGFDPKKRHKAKLYLNYKLYKEGYVKLEGATTKDNKPYTYRLTFFGSGVILKDVFKQKKLASLSYLVSNYNFDYTSTNVEAYLKDGLDQTYTTIAQGSEINQDFVTIEDAIVFPLISHSDRLIYDSDSSYSGIDGITNLADVTNGGLKLTELKPAIRIHAIIKAIEAQYKESGIVFSDDFFNESNLPYYNLYMWLHTKTGGLFVDQEGGTFAENFTIQSTNSTDIRTSVGLIENGNSFTIPHPKQPDLYPKIAEIPRKLSLYVQTSVSDEFTVVIYDDQGNEFASYTGTQDASNSRFVAIPEKDAIDIDPGTYRFAIRSNTPGTFFVHARVERRKQFAPGKRYIEFFGEASVGVDTKVYTATQMPDMTILDFLTGLFKMFNLTAYVNTDGKIAVQTLEQFYNESNVIYDITKYIDKDTVTVDSIVPFRQVTLSYSGTDSFLAASYEDINNKDWGGLHYKENDNNLGSEYKITLPFEHFLFEKLIDVNDSSDTGIQIGWSADDKQSPSIGKPLLFYAVPKEINEPLKLIKFNNTTSVLSAGTSVYMPSNSLELGADLTDSANINFASEVNEYAGIPFKSTLFNNYYKNYILEIFDKQRRITNTSAYLPLRILSNIKLNDKILIADRLYKINKLTTDFERLLTKLELVNTTGTEGRDIVRNTVFTRGQTVTDCITVDSDIKTVDSTLYTVDCNANQSNDGYVIIRDSGNGTSADSNNISPTLNGDIVEVTPPTIAENTSLVEATSTTFKIGYQITALGKIGTSENIDEYGFLYSTSLADIQGTDVDDIAANAGVIKIGYPTASNFKRPALPLNSTYTNSSATSSTTYYWRFYARTNTSLNYTEADALSDINTITTL